MTTPSSANASDSVSRIASRHEFDTRIQIRIEAGDQIIVTDGWVRDLSESGLGAFVAQELTVGELVTLEIPLATSTELRVPAKVVRSLGTQYGFQFTALSAEQRAICTTRPTGDSFSAP
jgi:hypothetical protein